MPISASWWPSWSGCSAPWPCVAPPSVPRRRSPGDRARGPARRRRPPARLRRRELPVARAPVPGRPAADPPAGGGVRGPGGVDAVRRAHRAGRGMEGVLRAVPLRPPAPGRRDLPARRGPRDAPRRRRDHLREVGSGPGRGRGQRAAHRRGRRHRLLRALHGAARGRRRRARTRRERRLRGLRRRRPRPGDADHGPVRAPGPDRDHRRGARRAMIPPAPAGRLPAGFAVRLDLRTRRRDGGATLLGGSPLRLLRLSPRARELLATGRVVVGDATTAELAARLLDAGLAHPDLPPAAADDVTVVIPVKDRPAALARLLAALRADPAAAGLPVVVVDDGSAVPVPHAPGVRVIRHDRPRGPAAARNAGLRAATTPLVAFLDSDCVPRPGWLQRLRPHLDDPRLAVVAPRIAALHSDGPGWLAPYETAVSALDMGPRPAAVRPRPAGSFPPRAAPLGRPAAPPRGFVRGGGGAPGGGPLWRRPPGGGGGGRQA